MQIELENEFLNFKFVSAQAEITGRCNMRCRHCRASIDPSTDMIIGTFNKLLDFCEFDKNFNFTISGGEPFLNPNLYEFLNILKLKGVYEVVITTNGSLMNEEIIYNLKKIGIPKLTIQVSLDNVNSKKHDEFRQFKGAYDRAISTIKMLVAHDIFTSIRVTVTKQSLGVLEEFVKLAVSLKVGRIGLTSIVPSGRALEQSKIFVNSEDKKNLFITLKDLKNKYKNIEIVTGDPIKFFAGFEPIEKIPNNQDCMFFGGCEAGISRINCNSEGDITPCALLPVKILNINDNSTKNNHKKYVTSEVIHNLFEKKFSGKCRSCHLIRHCGGCRAVAYGLTGDYLGEDSTCFRRG